MSAAPAPGRKLVDPPPAADIVDLAALDYLDVSPSEAGELRPPVTNLLATFDTLLALRPPRRIEPAFARRKPGRRPTRAEDLFNVFTRLCDVAGAEDGPLSGRPVGVKDNIDVVGVPTTNACATKAYTPTSGAVVVERILAAGGKIVGKLTMDDYTSGATGGTSAFGPPLNPIAPARSSGGSGAAVRCGAVDLALGADQGGSARIPGSCRGVVALKATHGLVPSHGSTHLGHTIDSLCPMARSVTDTAILFGVLAGADGRDPQWVQGPIVATEYES
jgi:amidase